MKDLITEARELCERATGGPWTGKENIGVQTATGEDVFETGCGCCTSEHLSADDASFISRSRTLIPELCDALEKAEAQIENIHRSLDFAETQRQRSKSYTELAINNGLALGRIAVTIQHDFAPLPATPEEGE